MPRSLAAASISAIDAIIERGDDDQDRIGADRARFGDLPWIDHEILAQRRQIAGGARGDQIILMPLEIRRVGEHRQAGGAARGIGAGVIGGVEIVADQSFGRAKLS